MWDPVNWRHWRAVIKLDPDKALTGIALEAVLDCNPDAILVGGTQGITQENTWRLVCDLRMAGYSGTVVQEISEPSAVINGVDAHFIPIVLNSSHYKWIAGLHHESIKRYGDIINWSQILTEGYVICNTNSEAGLLTSAMTVDTQSAVAYSVLAEKLLGIPILYLEYSGVFGDPCLVETVARESFNLHVVYGGGIKNPDQARRMLRFADTIVIGNLVYENPEALVKIFNEI